MHMLPHSLLTYACLADCSSASELGDCDKENDAVQQLAGQLSGVQIMQQQTPTKPVQRPKPFMSVPTKAPPQHQRSQFGVGLPAFKKQRESLAYQTFHE